MSTVQKPDPLPDFTSNEDARRHAIEFCLANTTWKPIFEIKDESLYSPLPWERQPGFVKKPWRRYRPMAREAWEEFGTLKLDRFRSGFVGGSGAFYSHVRLIPFRENCCMVFEVGGRPGLYDYCVEYDRDGKHRITHVVDARRAS